MARRGLAPLIHPLASCGFGPFWKHYFENWPYSLRSLHARVLSACVSPVRAISICLEGLRHNRAIGDQAIEGGPVFLVGHWRSGTTHLHNLLSQDPRFGFISFFQAVAPLDCLAKTGITKTAMKIAMPKTRGMDQVMIDADMPQEEEFALASMGALSFMKCFYFPRKLDYHFRRSTLFEDLGPGELEKFAERYRFLIRKMTYINGGKMLLLKNPANTARMSFLKGIFPKAKFVHIVRDPLAVYPSMLRLWDRLLTAFSWQNPKGIDFGEVTLANYERLMRAHIEDREAIPDEDFHEIRYEDLDRDPLAAIGGIYDALGLEGKAEAMGPIASYAAAHADYRKGSHELPEEARSQIAERWAFAFDRWGYTP